MSTRYVLILSLSFLTFLGYANIEPFTPDSIPLIGDNVVFTHHFEADLSKEELQSRAYLCLNSELNPHSGLFMKNSADSTVCQLTDYLGIESNILHVFGMYMTYNLKLVYSDGACDLIIDNMTFMEKSDFERQEESARDLFLQSYAAKMIMVDKRYNLLLKKNASEKITEASINRLNEIVRSLELYFVN